MKTTPPLKIPPTPYAPNKTELQHLYPNYSKSLVSRTYRDIRIKHPTLIKQPRCLTNHQFIEFMKILGLPQGFKHSDFPFLEDIKVY